MSTEPAADVEVSRSISVPLPAARTFELFTERMTDYWPKEHSIGSSEIAAVVLEPRAGGRWYERGVDGNECQWGRVDTWDPPRKIVLLWQIGSDWKFNSDFVTEVEVTFTEEPTGRTRVDLRHRNLQRYGDDTEQMRAIFDDPNGWTGTLARFADIAKASGGQQKSTMEFACEERQDFLSLLTELAPEQWEQQSLCEKWRVRDVVAHVLSYDELGRGATVWRFIRGAFVPSRVNQVGVNEYARRSPAQLTELMRACLQPRGLTAGFGGMIALVDGMVHQQDIRRPLGIPRVIPEDRLRAVLNFSLNSPAIRGNRRTRGVRLVADDIDWTHGDGLEVRGPGEALMMVMAARPDALKDLTGPGKSALSQRICG